MVPFPTTVKYSTLKDLVFSQLLSDWIWTKCSVKNRYYNKFFQASKFILSQNFSRQISLL